MSAVEKSKRNDRLVLLIGFLIFLLTALLGSVSQFTVLTIERQFGLSIAESENWWIAGLAGQILGCILAGRLFARLGAGRIILLGSTVVVLVSVGNIVLTSWSVMVPLAFLKVLGASMLYASLTIYIVLYFSARVIIWFYAVSVAGTIIFRYSLTGYMYTANWQTSAFIFLVVHIIIAILFIFTREKWRMPLPDDRMHTAQLRHVLRSPIVWVGVVAFALKAGIDMSGDFILPTLTAGAGNPTLPNGAELWRSAAQMGSLFVLLFLGLVKPWLYTRWLLRLCIGAALMGALLVGRIPFSAVNFWGYLLMVVSIVSISPLLLIRVGETIPRIHLPIALGLQIAFSSLFTDITGRFISRHFQLDTEVMLLLICILVFWVFIELAGWLSRPKKKKLLPDELENSSATI